MPELPDVSVYVERLAAKAIGHRLQRVRLGHPFLLRSVTPPLADVEGRTLVGVERLGKRIVLAFEGDLFIVVHLMIAGRLRWLAPDRKASARGAAVLLVSEDLDELLELSDRIAVMSEGRIVFETPAAGADRKTIGAHMGGGHHDPAPADRAAEAKAIAEAA